MGRLIDADKLKAAVEGHEVTSVLPLNDYEYGYNSGIEMAVIEIEDAAEVDAIPVDWIVNFKNSIKAGALMEPREVIKFMLEAWKEDSDAEVQNNRD